MGEEETIKIVGHSQGAAFAAGMATYISKHSKYSSRLEVVYYLAPDQPNQFRHPDNINGVQLSTKSDWVSSGSGKFRPLAWLRNSRYEKIDGVSEAYGRKRYKEGRGGHGVETYLNEIIRYFRNCGVNVNVYE
jgi:hypothetical protein